jgi:hypothetical protein
MSLLQVPLPEDIPSRNSYTNVGQNPIGYDATILCNTRFWTLRRTCFREKEHVNRCPSSVTGTTSVDTWQYLNAQFPNRWISHGGPNDWPLRSPDLTLLNFHEGKTWCIKAKKTEERNYTSPNFRLCKTRGCWISNTRKSVSVINRTCIHMTFLTGNCFRNRTLNYWQNEWTPCTLTAHRFNISAV